MISLLTLEFLVAIPLKTSFLNLYSNVGFVVQKSTSTVPYLNRFCNLAALLS
jgi:hypothetical protein